MKNLSITKKSFALAIVGTIITGIGVKKIIETEKKIDKILDEYREVKETIETGVEKYPDEYTVEDQEKDTIINNTKLVVNLSKAYFLPFSCFIFGMYLMCKNVFRMYTLSNAFEKIIRGYMLKGYFCGMDREFNFVIGEAV